MTGRLTFMIGLMYVRLVLFQGHQKTTEEREA